MSPFNVGDSGIVRLALVGLTSIHFACVWNTSAEKRTPVAADDSGFFSVEELPAQMNRLDVCGINVREPELSQHGAGDMLQVLATLEGKCATDFLNIV
jgi:hypothetical protein